MALPITAAQATSAAGLFGSIGAAYASKAEGYLQQAGYAMQARQNLELAGLRADKEIEYADLQFKRKQFQTQIEQINYKIQANSLLDNLRRTNAAVRARAAANGVDIGGGIDPYPNYVTVDQRSTADYVCDLNNGIPLPDNSVGVLNASHIIEHLHDKNKTMAEIHRVLAHGGWAFIEVPSTDGRGAFQDPTHVSYWNENSFLYYTHEGLARYIENDTIRFQEFRKETYFPNEWMQSINVSVTWLTAVKEGGQRYPHGLYI